MISKISYIYLFIFSDHELVVNKQNVMCKKMQFMNKYNSWNSVIYKLIWYIKNITKYNIWKTIVNISIH